MTERSEKVVELRAQETLGGKNGNDGNGNLIRHRLGELERRMGVLEGKVDLLTTLCNEINTKINGFAEKSYVLRWFGITLLVTLSGCILTLIGHLLIRSFSVQ